LIAAAVAISMHWVYLLVGRLALFRLGLLSGVKGRPQLRNIAELAPHLLDHVLRRLANRHHGHRRESERQHAADQQPHQHVGVGSVDVDLAMHLRQKGSG